MEPLQCYHVNKNNKIKKMKYCSRVCRDAPFAYAKNSSKHLRVRESGRRVCENQGVGRVAYRFLRTQLGRVDYLITQSNNVRNKVILIKYKKIKMSVSHV